MQTQSTYWLEKVLKMISLCVNALLCTLQHIVIHAMQLRRVYRALCEGLQYTLTQCTYGTHASQVAICSHNTDNVLYELYISTLN